MLKNSPSEKISTAEEYLLELSPQQLIVPKTGNLELTVKCVSEEKQDILVCLHSSRLEIKKPRGKSDIDTQFFGVLSRDEALTVSIAIRDSTIPPRFNKRNRKKMTPRKLKDSTIDVYCYNHDDDDENGLWTHVNSETSIISDFKKLPYWSQKVTIENEKEEEEKVGKHPVFPFSSKKAKKENSKDESKEKTEEKEDRKTMKKSTTLESTDSMETVEKEEKVKDSKEKEKSKEISKVVTPEKLDKVETKQPESIFPSVQTPMTPPKNQVIIKENNNKKNKKKKRGCCVIS